MGHGAPPPTPGLPFGLDWAQDPVSAPNRASLVSSLIPHPHKLLIRQLGPKDRVGGTNKRVVDPAGSVSLPCGSHGWLNVPTVTLSRTACW